MRVFDLIKPYVGNLTYNGIEDDLILLRDKGLITQKLLSCIAAFDDELFANVQFAIDLNRISTAQ